MEYMIRNQVLEAKVGSYGAELLGLQSNGMEYMWQGQRDTWNRTAPIMFPIIGGWENDTYYTDDKAYRMQKNGFARTMDFSVVSVAAGQVTLELISNAETYSQYPYQFRLEVLYTLVDNMVDVRYLVENLSDREMPFAVGGHPGFKWPIDESEDQKEYDLLFEKEETLNSFSPNGQITPFIHSALRSRLKQELFIDGARCFNNIQSSWVALAGQKRQVRIHRKEFPYLALWTQGSAQAKFICIEPCLSIGASGPAIYDRNNIVVLEKKSKKSYAYQIEVVS